MLVREFERVRFWTYALCAVLAADELLHLVPMLWQAVHP